METTDRKYYNGFEGEPEIHFISKTNEKIYRMIVWDGFFDQIMCAIKPVNGKWTSLAYFYHLLLGWNEEDGPWKVNKPEEALAQLNSIDKKSLEAETVQVLEEICDLFLDGIKSNAEIFIEAD